MRDALKKVGWKKPTGGVAEAVEFINFEWDESVLPEISSFYWGK